jgi:hypothetical protein
MRKFLVVVAAVLTVALPSAPAHAIRYPPPPLLIFLNGTSPGCYLYPNGQKAAIGGSFTIENAEGHRHVITQSQGFWKATFRNFHSSRDFGVHASGTYWQNCDAGSPTGPITVPVTAPRHPASSSFKVTWADSAAGSTWSYGVQYRIGSGHLRGWKSNTKARSATFHGVSGKTYYFRARVRNPVTGKHTDWSSLRKVSP